MKTLAKNKKIYFDYEISDTLDTGIILRWFEFAACKSQKPNISNAFVKVSEWELRIINMNIPLYTKTSPQVISAYEPKWRRKLLATKKQIARLRERTQKTWLQLVPTQIYLSKDHKVKVTIWLAKRKKKIEKRQSMREKDSKRTAQKAMKQYR